MAHTVNVAIEGGASFRARTGQTLLDAALANGVDMPHDCRSGHCGTCRCTVTAGGVEGGAADAGGDVLACQARLVGDVEIAIEETPPVETYAGRVRSLERLAGDVVEVVIDTRAPFHYLPGQYCQVRFAGLPGRCYSPTAPLEGPVDRGAVRLHIRQIAGGRVSQALGREIQPGGKVKVDGPFGSAFLRPGRTQRLVLAASGTGFAPIWSVARAALAETPDREIVAVIGARNREAFYMAPALRRMLAFPRAQVTPVLQYGGAHSGAVRLGSPADYLPRLNANDIVYAAGAPGMVQAIADIAQTAGAACYADPFAPADSEQAGFPLAGLIRSAARAVERVCAGALRQSA